MVLVVQRPPECHARDRHSSRGRGSNRGDRTGPTAAPLLVRGSVPVALVRRRQLPRRRQHCASPACDATQEQRPPAGHTARATGLDTASPQLRHAQTAGMLSSIAAAIGFPGVGVGIALPLGVMGIAVSRISPRPRGPDVRTDRPARSLPQREVPDRMGSDSRSRNRGTVATRPPRFACPRPYPSSQASSPIHRPAGAEWSS